MRGFSIIICAYNPSDYTLQRLLDALLGFDDLVDHEVIIVDNNSTPSLSQNNAVNNFCSLNPNSKLISEKRAGLTSARIAGIKEAKYDWLIFFDEDNEPSTDYLKGVQRAILKYHNVGAWGAGTVEVVYIDEVEDWLQKQKKLFQQRNEAVTKFENLYSWQSCYPFGTGMVIKYEIAEEYVKRVETGRYTLSDRKGKSLASGGDVQLILTGIDMGFAAGVVAGLSIHHLIDKSKANLCYLRKQQYGTASAYIKAFNQVFREKQIPLNKITNLQILKKMYTLTRIYRQNCTAKEFSLIKAAKLGELNSVVYASEQPKPLLLRLYEKLINA